MPGAHADTAAATNLPLFLAYGGDSSGKRFDIVILRPFPSWLRHLHRCLFFCYLLSSGLIS